MQTERVYEVGDRVRVKTPDGWRSARVVEVDEGDSVLPYLLEFEDGAGMWIVAPHIVPDDVEVCGE